MPDLGLLNARNTGDRPAQQRCPRGNEMDRSTQSRSTPGNLAPFSIRPKAAAALIGISERLLWEWTRDHGVPHFRLGNVVLYPVRELQAWVSA